MPVRRIDYHHRAEVFVKADMTVCVSLRNVSKGSQLALKKLDFVAVMKAAEEGLRRAESDPRE